MAKRGGCSAEITKGSNNIFEHLGDRNPADRQAKLGLAYVLNQSHRPSGPEPERRCHASEFEPREGVGSQALQARWIFR